MKKTEIIQLDQDVFIFDNDETEDSGTSTPSSLTKKQNILPRRRSKFQEAMKKNLKEKLSFNAHLLKQNILCQKNLVESEDSEFKQKDICEMPTEMAELNAVCQEIFIADELNFDFKTENKTFGVRAKSTKDIGKKNGGAPTYAVDVEIKTQKKVGQIESAVDPMITQIDDLNHQNKDIQISGLTIERNLGGISVQITNKISLLLSPVPPGIVLNCKLRRSRAIMNLLTPEYDLFLQNGLQHIVSAQKKILSNTEAFSISTQIGNYDKQHIVGSLRSNILHNEFLIVGKEQGKQVKFKFIYGSVNYGKLNKEKTQRPMTVTIPIRVTVGVRADHIKAFSFDSLSSQQKLMLHRKNQEGQKSEKNMVLIDEEEDDYSYLKLVKENDNMYSIEIQHPLSPMQAFGIALTRFDAQLR